MLEPDQTRRAPGPREDHHHRREAIRRILRTAKVTFQTTTTWKASNDPDFVAKMNRVLHLYDHPPDDGRVLCYDEFGPLNLMPRKGKA